MLRANKKNSSYTDFICLQGLPGPQGEQGPVGPQGPRVSKVCSVLCLFVRYSCDGF